MRKINGLLLALAALAVNGAVIPVESYKFDIPVLPEKRNSYEDKEFKKLTDGDPSGKSRVIWEYKKAPQRVINITFKLKESGVEKLHLDIFRGPRSYGIKEVKLFAIVDGKKVEAASKLFKHPYQLGKEDKNYEKLTVEIPATAPKAVDYELVISGTGSYLGLCEVSFEKK